MNKFLLSATAVAMLASSATAGVAVPQSALEPANSGEGYSAVDLEAYPAGMSSFGISGQWRINRDCKEFVTLLINDKIVKQVPASNVRDTYCIDGFDKSEVGAFHVTFHNDQQSTLYKYTGYYTVIIPAGFLTNEAGEPADEVVARYEINNSRYTSEPATGASVETLSKVTLTFPDALTLTANAACDYEFLSDGPQATADPLEISAVINGNTATFTFPKEFNTKGRLMLGIRTGAFTTSYDEGPASSTTYDGMVTINVTGMDISEGGEWTVTPAPGAYDGFKSSPVEGTGASYDERPVQALFLINAPEGRTIKMVMPSAVKFVKAGETSGTTFGKNFTPDKKSVYLFNTASQRAENTFAPTPGEYELVVPANLINLDDNTKNKELRFKYTVLAPEKEIAYTITPDPAETLVAPITKIEISFPEATSITWKSGSYINITCGAIEYVATAEVDPADSQKLIISINGQIAVNGRYDFSVPSDALSVDGTNCGIDFSYNLDLPTTSIEAIDAENGVYDVYTLDGVKVADAVDADAVKSLAPAVYIVIGRKVVVK